MVRISVTVYRGCRSKMWDGREERDPEATDLVSRADVQFCSAADDA